MLSPTASPPPRRMRPSGWNVLAKTRVRRVPESPNTPRLAVATTWFVIRGTSLAVVVCWAGRHALTRPAPASPTRRAQSGTSGAWTRTPVSGCTHRCW